MNTRIGDTEMARKKAKAKKVEEVEEVLTETVDEEAEPAPPPAIKEERTLKVVDGGCVTFYTQSEYDEKFNQ